MTEQDKHFAVLVAFIVVQIIIGLNNRYHLGKILTDIEQKLLGGEDKTPDS